MKIKTKKKIRLDELIKHVWENEVYPSRFVPEEFGTTRYVEFSDGGMFRTGHGLHENDAFTVEVEEELTEETEIHGATFVYYDELKREIKPFRYADVTSPTLKHIIQPRPGTVALAVFRGKQLIWSKEHGIPADGVLEVSE